MPAPTANGLVIYEPKGAAREYAALATNPYIGCEHGCSYCYGPGAMHKTREAYMMPQLRQDYLVKLERDAQRMTPGEPIHLGFACDAYCLFDVEHQITRQAIEILHKHGHSVSVLTKGGSRSLRDLDLLGPKDAMGATLTFDNDADSLQWEPNAALPGDRLAALRAYHDEGVPTWASMEPVIVPAQSLELIRMAAPFVDTFKLGRWNHDVRAKAINWHQYATEAVALVQALGRDFMVKDALRPFLPEEGAA
jgi:DNA repair photolyase